MGLFFWVVYAHFVCRNPLETANLLSSESKYTTKEIDMKIWNAQIFQ